MYKALDLGGFPCGYVPILEDNHLILYTIDAYVNDNLAVL